MKYIQDTTSHVIKLVNYHFNLGFSLVPSFSLKYYTIESCVVIIAVRDGTNHLILSYCPYFITLDCYERLILSIKDNKVVSAIIIIYQH